MFERVPASSYLETLRLESSAMYENQTRTVAKLRERVENLLAEQRRSRPSCRVLIALAGVPGSGKSTIAATLLEDLKRHGVDDVAILPMDGFHYPRAVLSSFDDPDLALKRRGAPFTFDARGFLKLIRRLKTVPVTTCDEPQIVISAPSFDHAVKDPLPDAIAISSRTKVVIIEGNYTLLDEDPWNSIADLVDDRWFVDVPTDVARQRLASRHLSAGIEKTMERALLRVDENDVPNGDHIRSNLIEPTIRILN
ncbi:putative uridine kinase [Colletotrichum aenigma]|uniref:putative uridine kinase n=1 Tax=Colletotrichum aenigma TaxID=1215731 RepID=UPI001872EE3C|nr:putative uridine kinase [Colletotrichum aenigma]KAF5525588.1 putative uridine kinase [Colletotrichum aenigma]